MRADAFEIECFFGEVYSAAEVLCGRAPLLKSVHLRNVRGDGSQWLRVSAVIGGKSTRRISVRDVPVNDEGAAAAAEKKLADGLTLPDSLIPGQYSGELLVTYDGGEKRLPFRVNILSASWIPTDFAHAPWLAAWVRTSGDRLRRFAADAVNAGGADALEVFRSIYAALSERGLLYQPVPTTVWPDFEVVSDPVYVLEKGGSCADLSLLAASLLWQRGLSPVLLVYPNHMTAGCFPEGADPAFETLMNRDEIQRMLAENRLWLAECTGVCTHRPLSFQESLLSAAEYLKNSTTPCCLVHLKRVLRGGVVRTLPDSLWDDQPVCPSCGFNRFPISSEPSMRVCPACGACFTRGIPARPAPAAPPDGVVVEPGVLRYGVDRSGAFVRKCLDPDREDIGILARWQNRPVSRISAGAFENCRIRRLDLPADITRIGDRAFRNCSCLTSVSLPEDLSALGSGAFSSCCALASVRIPGSLKIVPVFAFSGCEALENVTLEEGIERIDDQAFAHCPSLKFVHIPASVKRVCKTAFDPGCRLILASQETRLDN